MPFFSLVEVIDVLSNFLLLFFVRLKRKELKGLGSEAILKWLPVSQNYLILQEAARCCSKHVLNIQWVDSLLSYQKQEFIQKQHEKTFIYLNVQVYGEL